MDRPGFFVTGTDTGIGKTHVSRLLLEGFGERHSVTYMKPVQTGCVRDESGDLKAPDFDEVMKPPAVMTSSIDDHVPYRFEPACSPHLAAARAGETIDLETILNRYTRVSRNASLTIVEGAGGVLTPLSPVTSMIDLMASLRLPIILVTSPRVGTINHTLLTLEALACQALACQALAGRGIVPVGLVVNTINDIPEKFIYDDTCRLLRERLPQAVFLETEYGGVLTDAVREFCNVLAP